MNNNNNIYKILNNFNRSIFSIHCQLLWTNTDVLCLTHNIFTWVLRNSLHFCGYLVYCHVMCSTSSIHPTICCFFILFFLLLLLLFCRFCLLIDYNWNLLEKSRYRVLCIMRFSKCLIGLIDHIDCDSTKTAGCKFGDRKIYCYAQREQT